MSIVNPSSGTRVDEVDAGVFRISTPIDSVPGGFSFNQYLALDDEPLLFHTGPRKLFPLVREAVAHVMPLERLRWIGFSHVESDECGSLNEFLAAAPNARPLCGAVAAMVQMNDLADREPRALRDRETLTTGKRVLEWLDAPHVPHAWECGFLMDTSSKVLFAGDLFTQPGLGAEPLTEGDILEPSEAFRAQLDYYSHTKNARPVLEKIAATSPRVLACMHGAAWRGDGAKLLRALADSLGA